MENRILRSFRHKSISPSDLSAGPTFRKATCGPTSRRGRPSGLSGVTLVTGPVQIPRYLGGERTGSVFQGLTTPFRQDPPRGIGRAVLPDLNSEAPSAFAEGIQN